MPKQTNQEFVRDLMMFSPFGSLSEVFILAAIENYARSVKTHPDAVELDFGLISKEAWVGIAKDIVQRIEVRRNDDT